MEKLAERRAYLNANLEAARKLLHTWEVTVATKQHELEDAKERADEWHDMVLKLEAELEKLA